MHEWWGLKPDGFKIKNTEEVLLWEFFFFFRQAGDDELFWNILALLWVNITAINRHFTAYKSDPESTRTPLFLQKLQ